MIIRRFLQWTATAPAEARAEGASALARAYVDGEFDPQEEADAESVMTALLDDPAPVVRLALALALGSSPRTPTSIATALAADRSDIAALVLEFSPVLTAPELVDAVAVGDSTAQGAVARRAGLDVGLCAALAEVADPSACIQLCRNDAAPIPDSALTRMLERFGDNADVRAAIGGRGGLAAALRFDLVSRTARELEVFVTARGWLGADRASRATRDAAEQACIAIAADTHNRSGMGSIVTLVRHLRLKSCLTPALILRAVLSGNLALFEAAISDLAGVPLQRVAGLVRDGRGLGFQSLYAKAGLPEALRPAFAAALRQAVGKDGRAGSTLQRGRIGQALAVCARATAGELGSVTALLRRLDAQAAREDARTYAREVMREASPLLLPRPVAADRLMPLAAAA